MRFKFGFLSQDNRSMKQQIVQFMFFYLFLMTSTIKQLL